MKKQWIKISAITGLGLLSIFTIGAITIANKVDYEVLSQHLLTLDNEGITFRVNFGVTNPSMFDVDIWNQKYDVFVAGRKTLEITSNDKYRVFSDSTSSIPLDVRLKWTSFYNNSTSIGTLSQVSGIANLPIVIRGTFSGKIGIFRLMKLPVRMSAPLSYFLP
jgi:LEA14-like dessication related protein